MSNKGYLKLPREQVLNQVTVLTDREFKLLLYLLVSVDWDNRHSNYGTTRLTVREIAKVLRWSVGSACETIEGLRKRGYVARVNRRLVVNNFDLYQKRVRAGERSVHSNEPNVRVGEQPVQGNEPFNKDVRNLLKKYGRDIGNIPR
jgi:hypothetical protein